jgi:hypothetical protein
MKPAATFALLRRRRWALSLALGLALLMNAMLAGIAGNQAIAAALDPLAAAATSPLCGEAGNVPGGKVPAPGIPGHQQECPLCGPACPMAGAPLAVPASAEAPIPAPGHAGSLAVITPAPAGPPAAFGLFRSDVAAQAPPRAA